MAGRSPPRRRDTSRALGAGAAGGGIGTTIAAIANTLPQSSEWKSILLLSAPSVAVLISSVGLFAKTLYVDSFMRSRKERAALTSMDQLLDDARQNKSKVMSDPHTSEEHKRAMTRLVEQLEELKLMNVLKRMEVLALDEH